MVLQKYADDLDDSLRLWRYMNFDQFVHILATEKLWLAPLSGMEDQREGEWIEGRLPSTRAACDRATTMPHSKQWYRVGSGQTENRSPCGTRTPPQTPG